MLDKGALVPCGQNDGKWTWSYPGQEPHARISYDAKLGEEGTGWFRLSYSAYGTLMNYRDSLVTSRPAARQSRCEGVFTQIVALYRPNYGGLRWWY